MPDADAPLRLLIVDDEPLARTRLRRLLAEVAPQVEVIGEAASAAEVEAWLGATPAPRCDVLLLDIQLPGRDGLQLAGALQRLPQPPQVVFVTAHAEHAVSAFELEATDYLTKPVARSRLADALRRVQARRPAPTSADGAGALVFSERGRLVRMPLGAIVALKAEQKYVTLLSDTGREHLLEDSLADLLPRLGPGFLRVHRNAIVARRAVRSLERVAGPAADPDEPAGEGWAVRLRGGQTLAVSRRQLASVREALAQP